MYKHTWVTVVSVYRVHMHMWGLLIQQAVDIECPALSPNYAIHIWFLTKSGTRQETSKCYQSSCLKFTQDGI